MSRDVKAIAAEALQLPPGARAELASQLLDSLDDLSEKEIGRGSFCETGISQEVMRARFLRPAEAEAEEAVVYFDEQRPGLGDRFER